MTSGGRFMFFWLAIFILFISSSQLHAGEPVPISALYGQEMETGRLKSQALPLSLKSTLIVQEQNETRHARIYLQDIAKCSGSLTLCREILAVDLGPSPKPGQEKSFMQTELRKALDLELPQQQIDLQLPNRVRIIAVAQPVEARRIREQVEQSLPNIEGHYKFYLTNIRVPVGLRLRHDNYRVEFPSWTQDFSFIRQNPRRSLVNLMVRLIDEESGSTEQYDLTVQVALRAEVQAAVVIKAMERGQLLDKESVAFQWVPYQENVVRSPADLDRQLLRSMARPGQVLRNFDISRDPDVRRGEKVEASVVSNGVKMNSSAQAMESAAMGQRIRVQLDTTKRQVIATVTGRSKVEVHMP